jgi:hypothetical protein
VSFPYIYPLFRPEAIHLAKRKCYHNAFAPSTKTFGFKPLHLQWHAERCPYQRSVRTYTEACASERSPTLQSHQRPEPLPARRAGAVPVPQGGTTGLRSTPSGGFCASFSTALAARAFPQASRAGPASSAAQTPGRSMAPTARAVAAKTGGLSTCTRPARIKSSLAAKASG